MKCNSARAGREGVFMQAEGGRDMEKDRVHVQPPQQHSTHGGTPSSFISLETHTTLTHEVDSPLDFISVLFNLMNQIHSWFQLT